MTSTSLSRCVVRCTALLAVGSAALFAQAASPRRVSIKFQPMVGAEAFACGRSYSDIGTSKATITPSDFALYVHDVKLLTPDGAETPVVLDQDGVFQNGNLALLDFEDGTGPCSNGNAPTHTEIQGTAPNGRYVGVRFTIGVPFERNHLELTTQPSPLSITRMFWAWNSGHKFARLDAKSSTGKSWVLHLGSTGCTPAGGASTVPTSCAQENQIVQTFAQFDVDGDAIVVDAAALFAGNGGTENQVCMSSPKTAACAPMFAALGLSFNGSAVTPQTFLRRLPGASAKAADK